MFPVGKARNVLGMYLPMRFLLALGCWLLLAANLPAAPLTVVTWNTKWLPGGRPNATERAKAAQMKKAQAIVKALNPDVLLLQEVADWKAAEELCSVVPGLKVHTVSAFTTRPQNLVVASKLPADSAWYSEWKPTLGPDLPPRGYAFAALQLPGGRLLLAYSVHFKSNLGGIDANVAPREEAARQLIAHIREMTALYGPRGGTGVVVGGDFNSDPDDSRYAKDHTIPMLRASALEWAFKNLPHGKRITIPAAHEFPDGTFDHILYSGLKLLKVSVADGTASSDHNPVAAQFQP
ncbi:MAG TPA: endonuclease/exonuclease/phosphatase family protein [Chthoniobacterales bacterium]